jgi:RNA polymerase sigma-70 factor (ECF subfamily)
MVLMLEKLRGGAVREPDRIGSFVLGAARMLARDERRAAMRESAQTAVEIPHAPPEPDPFAARQLARCMEALAHRERTVVVLTYYGESKSGDIGATLGVAEGHVRVLRHRAIARLRECLGADGRSGSAESGSAAGDQA